MNSVYLKQNIEGIDFYYELKDNGMIVQLVPETKSIGNPVSIILKHGFEIIEESEYDLIKRNVGF